MANPEHLEILMQGVEVWNKWRVNYPLIFPDLTEAGLRRAKLTKVNLTEADLRGADLDEANLSRASLLATVLSESNLNNTGFDYAEIGRTIFADNDRLRRQAMAHTICGQS
jgi:hypothetical protein